MKVADLVKDLLPVLVDLKVLGLSHVDEKQDNAKIQNLAKARHDEHSLLSVELAKSLHFVSFIDQSLRKEVIRGLKDELESEKCGKYRDEVLSCRDWLMHSFQVNGNRDNCRYEREGREHLWNNGVAQRLHYLKLTLRLMRLPSSQGEYKVEHNIDR